MRVLEMAGGLLNRFGARIVGTWNLNDMGGIGSYQELYEPKSSATGSKIQVGPDETQDMLSLWAKESTVSEIMVETSKGLKLYCQVYHNISQADSVTLEMSLTSYLRTVTAKSSPFLLQKHVKLHPDSSLTFAFSDISHQRIAGYWVANAFPTDGSVYEYFVYVEPEYRGKDVALALSTIAFEVLKNKNITKLVACIISENYRIVQLMHKFAHDNGLELSYVEHGDEATFTLEWPKTEKPTQT